MVFSQQPEHSLERPRFAPLATVVSLISGAVNVVAEILLLPSLILAFFAAELTPSYPLIGLVPALAASLWTLARVPAHLLITRPARQQQWAFATALVRAGALAVLAFATLRTSAALLLDSGRALLLTFFLCLMVYTFASGLGSVPAAALARMSAEPGAQTGLPVRRSLVGLLASVLGALLAARLVGEGSPQFPGNFGRLFLVAAALLLALAILTILQRPRPAAFAVPAAPFSFRLLLLPLADSRYLRYAGFRILLAATAAIDPFLFLYAVIRLGVPASSIGVFIVAGVLGWVLTSPLWAWLEHKAQPRTVLQAAAVLRLVAPALAILVPQLLTVEQLQPRLGPNAPATVFAIAFFAIGASLSALARGGPAYLSSMAPRTLGASYSALTSGILALAAFAPVAGGLIIQRYSYEVLFIAAIVLGLAGVLSSGWLAQTAAVRRPRPVTASPVLP